MKKISLLLPIILILSFSLGSIIHDAHGKDRGVNFVSDEIIVKFKEGIHVPSLDLERLGVKDYKKILRKAEKPVKSHGIDRLYLLEVEGLLLQKAIEDLRRSPVVEYAEPNYIVHILEDLEVPNDPGFGKLYGLHNTGQTGGTPDADIDAPEAWYLQTGDEEVIIAVIDTGVEYEHPDLAANIWTNTDEIPGNGIDDDRNGFRDDTVGWDFFNDDKDPTDDNGHGTHCAGIIGARGNNGVGVVGVNWNVRIMPLKFLGAGGTGTTSDVISAIAYATDMRADIMSNSWGGGGYSEALKDAIEAANSAGILFVVAAGNSNSDNDSYPHYPSSYDVPNIVAVAATDDNDEKASFSCYGNESVDLGAPGVDIYSTVPLGDCPNCDSSGNGYIYLSGTSMATPYVAAVAGLITARFPGLTRDGIKSRLLGGVDPIPSLEGRTLTGGRLNAYNCLEDDQVPPSAVGDLETNDPSHNSVTLTWTATGDDANEGTAKSNDVRYSTSPITEDNWDNARRATGEPRPHPPGSMETFVVTGLSYGTTYYFALKVSDNVGNVSSLSNVEEVTTTIPTILFEDDMESGENGWTSEGLWHQETRRSSSPATSWAYNTGHPKYNYDLGHNWGGLTSPEVDLRGCSSATLTFKYWYHTENPFTYWDQRRIQILAVGVEDAFTDIGQLSGDPMMAWNEYSLDVSSYAGSRIQIRFFFDTIDKMMNSYEGWYVDDLVIFGEGEDLEPPTPDPMTWDMQPRATGSGSIEMIATTALDPSGVEYYFLCTGGGGHDSGWQESPLYEDTGLQSDTQYVYRVKARDTSPNQNVTGLSTEASATTEASCSATTLHVGSITAGTVRGSKGRHYGQVEVTVLDNCGDPVPGAIVRGTFSGDYTDTGTSGTTDSSGVAVITTTTDAKKPSYTFCIDEDGVNHDSLIYAPEDDLEDCEEY